MIAHVLAAVLTVLPLPLPFEPHALKAITGAATVDAAATGTATAERLDPPAPAPRDEAQPVTPSGTSASANGRCVGWEALLAHYSPGWDVTRMSRIAYRESRCQPHVRNPSGATGLLQLMPMHCRWLPAALGEPCTVARLQQAEYTIRAAAALWARDGYRPWAL